MEVDFGDENSQTFKTETVQKVIEQYFTDPKAKLTLPAAKLTAELMRCFVIEAAQRAMKLAEADDQTEVTPTYLEQILPQLLLDF